ncbi:MAG: PSD1 and planctomycete cytochrome C domain-containing protein [Planctomycetota bacterium]
MARIASNQPFRVALTIFGVVVGIVGTVGGADGTVGGAKDAAKLEFFEKHIRPTLAQHCFECHGGESDSPDANLRLDRRSRFFAGGDSGEIVVPGDPDASLLIQALRYDGEEMPPDGKLPDDVIAKFEQWVNDGAVWPDEVESEVAATPKRFDLAQRRDEHWAWQSIRQYDAPEVQNPDWCRVPADRFILAGLEQQGLLPAAECDPLTWLRRVSFDLTGLPPSARDVAMIQEDASESRRNRIVAELMASPEFGRRWGRHWLDVVRYAESRGHEFDFDIPNSQRYRDYVVDAWNADIPFDDFVREHIAGDLLANPRIDVVDGSNQSLLGTGFWNLDQWVHSPVDIRKDETDRVDNAIDTVSKAFLGMTVACARCHDHKFDAISAADYYAISGMIRSSDYAQVRYQSRDHNLDIAKRIRNLDKRFAALIQDNLLEKPGGDASMNDTAQTETAKTPPTDDSLLFDFQISAAIDHLRVPPNFARHAAGELKPPGETSEPAFSRYEVAGWSHDPLWDARRTISLAGTEDTGTLGKLPRADRTLATPTFVLEAPELWCRVEGTGRIFACVNGHRMIAGPLHKDTIVDVKRDHPWVRLKLDDYVGKRMHLEFIPKPKHEFTVAAVFQGNDADSRGRRDQWIQDTRNAVANPMPADGEWHSSATMTMLAEQWTTQRRQLTQQIRWTSKVGMALVEATPLDDPLLIRGQADKPGDLIRRRFLEAIDGDSEFGLSGDSASGLSGSGRRFLADRMTAADNPLTDRVIINRLWHHLMGRGIVATTDDFGVLGQRPTHPELLDFLAMRLREHDHHLKPIIREWVLSATYRMGGKVDESAAVIDPKNELWHHRPPRRLQAEAFRDSLLAVSGRLDLSRPSASVPVHLTSFMEGRGRPRRSGPIDGDGYRSIYLSVRRNFLSPMLTAFDFPVPTNAMGRRNVSNVPAQALILMNDPLVHQSADRWRDRLLKVEDRSRRIDQLFVSSYGRPPSDAERNAVQQFLHAASESGQSESETWREITHAFLNSKEFIFVP